MEPLIEQVKTILIDTLKLDPKARHWGVDAPLLGAVPQLTPSAIVDVIAALEDRFGIHIQNDEVSGGVFATLGALAEFVDEKMND